MECTLMTFGIVLAVLCFMVAGLWYLNHTTIKQKWLFVLVLLGILAGTSVAAYGYDIYRVKMGIAGACQPCQCVEVAPVTSSSVE